VVEHKNGQSLESLSIATRAKMWECSNGCPYNEYKSFYEYYGSHTYADDWVKGALDGTNVVYPNGRGSADFSRYILYLTPCEVARALNEILDCATKSTILPFLPP
jgi:hypothetical protein